MAGIEINGLHFWGIAFFVFVLTVTLAPGIKSQPLKKENKPLLVTDSNWTLVLDGEWMVEFMAPWCPACRAFKETWAEFAGWSHDLDISVGVVDVTENPGLSGRFLITSLPTVYHIKDGVFRQYVGGRKTTDLIAVIDEKKWEKIESVAWYRDPNSVQMSLVGLSFKAAMFIRGFYSMLVDTYGIPEWACYLIFAVLTIITGLLLGLLIVVFCDNFFPAKYIPLPSEQKAYTIPPADDTDLIDDTEENQEDSKKAATTSGKQDSSPKPSPEEGEIVRKRIVNKDS